MYKTLIVIQSIRIFILLLSKHITKDLYFIEWDFPLSDHGFHKKSYININYITPAKIIV